jgi:hypothetical protein
VLLEGVHLQNDGEFLEAPKPDVEVAAFSQDNRNPKAQTDLLSV